MVITILIILILIILYKSLKLYISFLAMSAVLFDRGLDPTVQEQKRAIAFVMTHSKKDFSRFVKGWLKI